MSSTTDQMTVAIGNIETALASLGSAHASYEAGRRQAKADRATAVGFTRAEDVDNAISTAQLNRVIAGRLCALGLEHVVLAGGISAVGTQPASWTVAWSAKVTATVP